MMLRRLFPVFSLLTFSARAVPIVDLGYATYAGTSLSAGVDQFLGMRFAAPPVGHLRWRAPADPVVETGLVDDSSHGSVCYNLEAAFDPTGTTLSEDCLFIDVYAPALTKNKLFPVWFFIQGGGYIEDFNPDYNGTDVVVQSGGNVRDAPGLHNVVLVTFNYRVGAFGFLASERVSRDGALNVGLLDQRKALLWVNKHISKFGGDPNHVVIHGVSAGAGSVTHHLTAFGGRNDGLFIGAIGESVFWPREVPVSELEFQFDLFASAAGCAGSIDQMACLRKQNTSTLVTANIGHPFLGRAANPQFFYTPTIDGDFVQDHLYTLFQEGKFIQVPMMLGDDEKEGTFFAANASTPAAVVSFLMDNYPVLTPADGVQITELYPLLPMLPQHAAFFPSAAAAYGEATFTCPSNFIATRMDAVGLPVWNYRFSVVQEDVEALGLGVPHASALPAIFGPDSIPDRTSTFTTTNAPMVPIVMNYWISFIRALNPNSFRLEGTPEWMQFQSAKPTRLQFDVPQDERERCAFWNGIGVRIEQ
ncbi:aEsta [Roridomyces roridus]|uniref:Carboxylic ester hydrolase n=1 Tax=Roridomyces roridus TaxID=1738132 RepID=A0AAD7BB39_9AGAR|nr:aEsta [Roridomyces roridus]